jgi:hypothetical protein
MYKNKGKFSIIQRCVNEGSDEVLKRLLTTNIPLVKACQVNSEQF